jgi:hypothetical protein
LAITVPHVFWTEIGVSKTFSLKDWKQEATIGDFLCYEQPIMVSFEEGAEPWEAYECPGIQSEATLHLVLRLRGGNEDLVDVTRTDTIQKLMWTRGAPEWLQAKKGLSHVGVCTSAECQSTGEMVVCNIGFHNFDLIQDDNYYCPICNCP